MIQTKLTKLLGIEAPIIQGGMQYVGYAEMASAVSNAGGLGILTALTQPTPEDLRKEIRRCRTMTSKPFGCNITILPSILATNDYDGYAKVIAEEKVALVEIAGGNPAKYVNFFHEHGVKVLHKTATVRHAIKAAKVGVDLIEVVGYEGSIAGGQPGDEVGVWVILTKVLEELKARGYDTPVISAGASGTGRQLAAALSMGAQGITMATRFLATKEAPVADAFKQMLAAKENDERATTIVLKPLNNATRVFRNRISMEINEIEDSAKDGISFSDIQPLASGKRTKHTFQVSGDPTDSMWSCGQSVGLINDVPSCKELIKRIVEDAAERIQKAQSVIISAKL